MELGRTSPPAVVRAARRLRDRLGRGLVLVGIVPEEPYAALLRALRGAGFGDVELGRVDSSPAPLPRLHELNRGRDLLLRRGALVLLSAVDEAGLRALLAATPDISSTPDLGFEIAAAIPVAEAERLLEQLRQHALEHTAKIDLSGLLPGDVAAARLPVERLYMELLDVQGSAAPSAPGSPPAPIGGAPGADAPPPARPIPRLLVFGQPGAGKTTFLRKLAQEYATGERDRLALGPRVPVFVPLPAYARSLEERRAAFSLLDFLDAWLLEQGVTSGGGVASLHGRVLLLLDGLDEVRGSALRRTMVEEARRTSANGGFPVVLASRGFVVEDLTAELIGAFTVRHLRPPDARGVHDFLRGFYAARGVPHPRREAARAWLRVAYDAELAELARSPLLLAFLAILHELEGRIPDRRFLLYQKITEILLDRWERARARARGAGAGGRVLALGDTRRVIGALAWWMLQEGRVEISSSELRQELAQIERSRGATEAEADARARGLSEVLQTGMAVFDSGPEGGWRFVHTTLTEFFAGVEASRGGARWEQLLAAPFRSDWREIVAFAAGELGIRADDERLEALAGALLRGQRRGGRHSSDEVGAIAAVLREDPGFSVGTTRRLVERFVDLCVRPRYWPRSRWAVAEELLVTGEVAMHRTWREELGRALVDTLVKVEWREDHATVAGVALYVLDLLGLDSTPVAEHMTRSGLPEMALRGWRCLYRRASPAAREGVRLAARQALPGSDAVDLSLDFEHLFLQRNPDVPRGWESAYGDLDSDAGRLLAEVRTAAIEGDEAPEP